MPGTVRSHPTIRHHLTIDTRAPRPVGCGRSFARACWDYWLGDVRLPWPDFTAYVGER